MRHELSITREKPGPWDMFSDLENTEEVGTGYITRDHAASCYGQPVLVFNGIAYGPADAVANGWTTGCGCCHWGESTPEEMELCKAWRELELRARYHPAAH